MKKLSATEASKNKKLFFIFRLCISLPILLLAVFCFSKITQADQPDCDDLIITEIMYDPEGNNTNHSKWIELYNPDDENIILKKNSFGIIDKKNSELGSDGKHFTGCHGLGNDITIKSNDFVIIADKRDTFLSDYTSVSKDIVVDSSLSLASTQNYIQLSNDKCETFFTSISYETSWGAKDNGKTLEKINFKKDNSKDNWQESYISNGTPGEKSSEKPAPKDYSSEIYINEILPNPQGDDAKGEYIELYNPTDKKIDLESWTLKDTSTAKYVFSDVFFIKPNDFLIIYRKDFNFALNNSNEAVYLFDPNNKEVSRTAYFESAKEDFSYAFDGSAWRWTSYSTPGKENVFDKKLSGHIIKDQTVYKNISAAFAVKTGSDAQKFTWDFGDGHKSYLKVTRHKYEKTGTFHASLKIRGLGEDAFYEFDVKVKKYAAPKIRIVKVSPNPKGSDTENEWLEIKNNSKKKINLKGWSVATGWNNLYNHPIREDFFIKAGKSKKLMRDICAFTLANTKTKIELRDPSGKVVQKIEYDHGKKSITEDTLYQKADGAGWDWLVPPETISAPDKSQAKSVGQNITATDVNMVISTPSNVEISANLGKYSLAPAWQQKQAYGIILANLNSNIKIPAAAIPNQPRVLGARTATYNGTHYTFTQNITHKHWAVQFYESLWLKMNSNLNNILNRT